MKKSVVEIYPKHNMKAPTSRVGFDTRSGEFWRMFEKILVPVLNDIAATLPGGRVLDIGCGLGFAIEYLLAKGVDAHGVEPEGDAFNHHSEKTRDRIRRMSSYDLEAVEERWDGIYMLDVIEHFQWPERVMHTCARLTDKLWVYTPALRLPPASPKGKPGGTLRSIWHIREWPTVEALTDFVCGITPFKPRWVMHYPDRNDALAVGFEK